MGDGVCLMLMFLGAVCVDCMGIYADCFQEVYDIIYGL